MLLNFLPFRLAFNIVLWQFVPVACSNCDGHTIGTISFLTGCCLHADLWKPSVGLVRLLSLCTFGDTVGFLSSSCCPVRLVLLASITEDKHLLNVKLSPGTIEFLEWSNTFVKPWHNANMPMLSCSGALNTQHGYIQLHQQLTPHCQCPWSVITSCWKAKSLG